MDGLEAHGGKGCCSFHCFFIRLSRHASIYPFVHPCKSYVRRVWYFLGHLFTWLAPRKWRGKHLVAVKCPHSTRKFSSFPVHSVQSSTFPSTCLAPEWLCLLLGHHKYALIHACPCLGFQAPHRSCPHFSSALAPPESETTTYDKGSVLCFQKTLLFEVSFSWSKIELLLIYKKNVMEGKISVCFLPWGGLPESSYSSYRFRSPPRPLASSQGDQALFSCQLLSAFFASQHLKKKTNTNF